jgi:hypothetical protein
MKRNDYKPLGTRTILGQRTKIAEHKDLNYYRIGVCNIPAMTLEDAIAKYVECQQRRAK